MDIFGKLIQIMGPTLERPDFRAGMVVSLLRGGSIQKAVDESLPLVGTPFSAWFLYARAWQNFSQGRLAEARRLHSEACEVLEGEFSELAWQWGGLAFSKTGLPQVGVPFDEPCKLAEQELEEVDDDGLCFRRAIARKDWLSLIRDIRQNRPAYEELFKTTARGLERIIHHDLDMVTITLDARFEEEPQSGDRFGRQLSIGRLQFVAETLWRVRADWADFVPLHEMVGYLFYLLGHDELALGCANDGLDIAPDSVACGNVRALVLNRTGQTYQADEQWQRTLTLRPEHSSTYLVLGHQALCTGELEVALRYFLEAHNLKDNLRESEQCLQAALQCLDTL